MSKSTIGFIIIVILLAAAGFFSLRLFLQQRIDHDILDIHAFPNQIGEWEAEELELTEREYEVLETRNLIFREYHNPDGRTISLFIIYSETNRSVFHPPEVCLLGGGVKIMQKKEEMINAGGRTFKANRMLVGKDNSQALIIYCYNAGSLYTDNYVLQQAFFALNQLFSRKRGGATIRVSMPIDQDEQATLSFLKSFLKQVVEAYQSLLI